MNPSAPVPSTRAPRRRPAPAGVATLLVLLVSATFVAGPALAQETGAQPAAPEPKPCSTPEYRQFDFWVGEWEVWTDRIRKQGGTPAHSRITLQEGGCVVQEEYTTSVGYSGRSLNYYDARDGKWHQVWVDNGGQPLVQSGGLQGDSMVLDSPGPDGALDRITWTPLEGGKVRQHWTRSKDGGKTWGTVFDGTYEPVKK